MVSILMVADERREKIEELISGLVQRGLSCSTGFSQSDALRQIEEQTPKLVIMYMNGHREGSWVYELPQAVKQERHIPVIALLPREALVSLDYRLGVDDFVVEPWDAVEVAVRAKAVLWRKDNTDRQELIKCGDLVVDLARCEVSLNGRLAELTFKEYELLRFLASNRGRVFTREALLNKVWGYDYFGGDRTIDVHIRRLRSKIEDATHTFIETVRNVGYRFIKSP